MNITPVGQDLQRKVREALSNPYRFERYERFAMRELLRACDANGPLDRIFFDTACAAVGHQATARPFAVRSSLPRISQAA